VGGRVEAIGGLVRQSRDKGRLLEGDSHTKWRIILVGGELDEVGLMPAQGDDKETEELIERKLSEEMAEQQLSNIAAELEYAVEWQANSTCNEVSMGDQDDFPFDLCEELEAMGEGAITQRRLVQQVKLEIDEEEEMQQQSRLQEWSQPMDKLDEEIEEIRRLMLKSTEETINNKWRLIREDCSGKVNRAPQHKVWKHG
jgi:hypothetical protein